MLEQNLFENDKVAFIESLLKDSAIVKSLQAQIDFLRKQENKKVNTQSNTVDINHFAKLSEERDQLIQKNHQLIKNLEQKKKSVEYAQTYQQTLVKELSKSKDCVDALQVKVSDTYHQLIKKEKDNYLLTRNYQHLESDFANLQQKLARELRLVKSLNQELKQSYQSQNNIRNFLEKTKKSLFVERKQSSELNSKLIQNEKYTKKLEDFLQDISNRYRILFTENKQLKKEVKRWKNFDKISKKHRDFLEQKLKNHDQIIEKLKLEKNKLSEESNLLKKSNTKAKEFIKSLIQERFDLQSDKQILTSNNQQLEKRIIETCNQTKTLREALHQKMMLEIKIASQEKIIRQIQIDSFEHENKTIQINQSYDHLVHLVETA